MGLNASSKKKGGGASNDGIGLIDLGTMTVTGTGVASVADAVERAYLMIQVDLTAISGTNAVATMTTTDMGAIEDM